MTTMGTTQPMLAGSVTEVGLGGFKPFDVASSPAMDAGGRAGSYSGAGAASKRGAGQPGRVEPSSRRGVFAALLVVVLSVIGVMKLYSFEPPPPENSLRQTPTAQPMDAPETSQPAAPVAPKRAIAQSTAARTAASSATAAKAAKNSPPLVAPVKAAEPPVAGPVPAAGQEGTRPDLETLRQFNSGL